LSDPISCDVAALAYVQAGPESLTKLRRDPGKLGEHPLTSGLLKHADDQTVAAVVAVLEAIRLSDLNPATFSDWAVLAAPRQFGRAAFDKAFPQFAAEGAWGVSPYLVPHHSLHSPSGTISQILSAHGPNFGVGGWLGAEGHAFVTAAVFLNRYPDRGVWIVLSGACGADAAQSSYEALALALVAPDSESIRPRLRLAPGLALTEIVLGLDTESSRSLDRFAAWISTQHSDAQSANTSNCSWRGDEPHASAATSAWSTACATVVPDASCEDAS
jgi:hypothetical protein